ncbi:hypothetical protein BKA56DRAFT_699969 [Ilyonectria sp. MPI-CAGE-AT-0026]|nr:hypothetical protein BKA56DRAFT_706256 [Ilyonectria sp. MPI-CAGE-AT-0026]KAH6961784.1 hypothetical protein BKA56DRAFT_699969 [Ilyonectria sp. MPI-CAGE-AT-0026]
MGRLLRHDENGRDLSRPFSITAPSIVETAKRLRADLPKSTYDRLEGRFEIEVREQGALFTSFTVTGQNHR